MTRARSGRAVLLGTAVMLLVAGCCNSSDAGESRITELEERIAQLQTQVDQAQPEAPSTTTSAAAAPSTTIPNLLPPTIDIEWFGENDALSYSRFLAWVTNPNDVPLTGIITRWQSFDKDGNVHKTWDHQIPTIDPLSRIPYAPLAFGSRETGPPTSATASLLSSGIAAPPDTPTVMLAVLETGLMFREGGRYRPAATVQAPLDRPIAGSAVTTVWILRDETGAIVGVLSETWTTLPPEIVAGERFKVHALVNPEDLDAPPTAVEAYVYLYEEVP